MKHRVKLALAMGVLLQVQCVHAEVSAFEFALNTSERLGLEAADILRARKPQAERITPSDLPRYMLKAENWTFRVAPAQGVFAITDSRFRKSRLNLDRRPEGAAPELLHADIKRMLQGLGWEEGVDYRIGESWDAGHPQRGQEAEAQAGLQVTSINLPAIPGWDEGSTIGTARHEISTGKLVYLMLATRPSRKTEDLSEVITLTEGAARARAFAVAYLQKSDPGALDQVPSVEELAANGGRALSVPWVAADPRFATEDFPEELRTQKMRAAIYNYIVGPVLVTVHATSGRVVRAGLKTDEGGISLRNAPTPRDQSASGSSSGSPNVDPQPNLAPRPEPPTAPPIPLLVGGGVAILGVGAVFLLARKRTP